MTNQELHEEIICIGHALTDLEVERARLEVKLEELKKAIEGDGVFKPDNGQNYYFISMDRGKAYTGIWTDHRFDYSRYALGNCFPTEQSAEDTVRVLKLIQKARESQSGFVPDWETGGQVKYFLNFHMGEIGIVDCYSVNTDPKFGFWGDESLCEQFIDDNHDELMWYFMEHNR